MNIMEANERPTMNEITYPAGTIADTKYGRNAIYPTAPVCNCGVAHPRKYVCKESK